MHILLHSAVYWWDIPSILPPGRHGKTYHEVKAKYKEPLSIHDAFQVSKRVWTLNRCILRDHSSCDSERLISCSLERSLVSLCLGRVTHRLDTRVTHTPSIYRNAMRCTQSLHGFILECNKFSLTLLYVFSPHILVRVWCDITFLSLGCLAFQG